MRKRTIIAGIITGFILFLTKSFWFDKFHFELFVIVFILSFLLAYKLVDYLADFKTVQNKSRADILFLVVFIILLFVPMLRIDNSETSKSENRKLAVWKSFINKNYKINYNFGHDFDDWYNDRFFGRSSLIKVKVFSDFYLNKKAVLANNVYFSKANKFMQYDLLPEAHLLSVRDKDKTVKAFLDLQKFCDENNIKLYVLIVPTNNFIYYENFYPYVSLTGLDKYNNQVEYIKEKSKINLLYLYDYFKSSKNSSVPAYYKEDNHWTEDGAYIGYTELIKMMKKDFGQLAPIDKDELTSYYTIKIGRPTIPVLFGDGDLFRPFIFCNDMLKYNLKTKYKYYKNKDELNITTTSRMNDYYLGYDYYYEKGIDKKVLITGTSFNINLLRFLPYNFKHLRFMRLRHPQMQERFKMMKYYKKDILQYKPDIIIYSIATMDIEKTKNLFEK